MIPAGSPLAVTVAPSVALNAIRSPYLRPTTPLSTTPPMLLKPSDSSASFCVTTQRICAVLATVFFFLPVPVVTFLVKVTT